MSLIYNFFNKNMNFILAFVGLFLVAVLSRLTAHLWNMTLVGSVAVLSGVLFKNKITSATLVVGSLFVTDFFIGFHNEMLVVYLSFIFMSLISARLSLKSKVLNVATSAMLGSICFYFITNFSVWLFSGMYPNNLTGLINCYVLGIPFFKNQFFADVLGSAILYTLAQIIFRAHVSQQSNILKNQEKLSLFGTSF